MVYEYESLTPTQGIVYVYGINLITSRNNSGVEKFYLYNAHGDVVQLVSSSGTVVKTYKYDAFGVEYDIDEDDTNYFRYCGQYFDTESGTYYLRARYYDPALGRFTQQDGWEYGDRNDTLSLNLYTYCHNDSVNYVDQSGNRAADTYGDMYTDAGTGDVEAVSEYLSLEINKVTNASGTSVYVVKMEKLPSNPNERKALLDKLSEIYGVIVVDDRRNPNNPNMQIHNSYKITD
jgi:RHS repeat-associated protein